MNNNLKTFLKKKWLRSAFTLIHLVCHFLCLTLLPPMCLSLRLFQGVRITSVTRTRSSLARQTTAASLSGRAVTAPTTALTTATSKAAVRLDKQHV